MTNFPIVRSLKVSDNISHESFLILIGRLLCQHCRSKGEDTGC